MVIGKYGGEKSISGERVVEIETVVLVETEEIFRSLNTDLELSDVEKIKWYFFDAIPVYFLDEHEKVVMGLEYWPITKPHGGFRGIRINQDGAKVFAGKASETGAYLLPRLARLIDSQTPEGFVWPAKGGK